MQTPNLSTNLSVFSHNEVIVPLSMHKMQDFTVTDFNHWVTSEE